MSLMKFEPELRRECAACNHAYLCGLMRVGEVAVPLRIWTPIMYAPRVFHEDEGGTRETKGQSRVRESLSRYPSSDMI